MKLKKFLSSLLLLGAAMFTMAGCALSGTASDGSNASMMPTLIMMIVIFAVFYFLMIVPENKRKKKAQQMRDNVSVGDKIVTIGGMAGKVVHVTDDRITFETGEDRVRIEVMKWAISSNEGKGANKETTDSEESLEGK